MATQDVNSLIKDSFDVIGLVLVFAFVLFDIRYPQIIKELERPIPPKERTSERRIYRQKFMRVLLLSNFPLVLGYGLLLYLFSPLLIKVISSSNIQLWGFDFLPSAFVMVFILIFLFFIWSAYLTVRVVKKVNQI